MLRAAFLRPARLTSNVASTSSTAALAVGSASNVNFNRRNVVFEGVRGFATWNHKPKKKNTAPKRFIRIKQETLLRCRSWFHMHRVKFGFDNVHEMEKHKAKDEQRKENLRLHRIREGEKDMSNPSWCTEKNEGKVAPYPQASEQPELKNVIVEGDEEEKIHATAIKAEKEAKMAPEVLRKQRNVARKFENYLWYFDQFKQEKAAAGKKVSA